MDALRCVVERITYQNTENGYAIIKVSVSKQNGLTTVVGHLADVPVGSVLLCKGEWKTDPRYGRQFAAESWEETLPATAYGIEKYLGSGLVKGIGAKRAKQIVAHFGADTMDIIETDIERLAEVEGIGKKRIEAIRDSWEKQRDIKNVMIFLQNYGVGTAYATKIFRQYGKESIEKVKENPYRLADDIWGIGFKTADSIAAGMGYEKNNLQRCRSGLVYVLNQLSEEGHVYAEEEQLVQTAASLLEADEATLQHALAGMTADGSLQQDGTAVYLPPFYRAECDTASRLATLIKAKGNTLFAPTDDTLSTKEADAIRYDEVQLQAISQAVRSKVMVLTGGPGTGKTTTTKAIISALQRAGMRVLLAAPTGRAAKRMSEATGMEAKTLHRLLEYNPAEGYQRNEENPLDGDALIVDECSMIDLLLMFNLLKAIPSSMRLILVGDTDQLPSVGAGNVLHDLIDSHTLPVVRLTRIFRQAQTSRIVMNAHAINKGLPPDIRNNRDSDFFFLPTEEAEQAATTIVELVRKRLPKAYALPSTDIQVLTPMQRGPLGATRLNQLLQQALNPTGESLMRNGISYRPGDRVMQLRNNYDKDVYNGDMGVVEQVDTEEQTLTVAFDGQTVTYETTELDELTLAYATTIHKSQGSEYPVVVMPVLMTHFVMLQRNLIYTGITRARKLCVLLGQKRALAYAIRNQTVLKRNTHLKERLQALLAQD